MTAQQAARSGNQVYTPRAGIAGGGATVTWRHAFTANWVGTLEGGVIQLRGAAANSPLTERKTTPAAAATIGYRFLTGSRDRRS